MSKSKLFISVVTVGLVAGALYHYYPEYYSLAQAKPAPSAIQATNNVLVFTSPPREPPEEGERYYQPIVDYLIKVTGKQIVYKHPGTWGAYRTEMLNGTYDIVFDGGHFTDYRAQKLGYHIVAKMPVLQEFAIIVRKDDKAATVDDLAGQTACAPPPPNQGTLQLLSQFNSPERQPIVVPVTSNFWPTVYENVVTGRCRGGVLVLANLERLDSKAGAIRILHKTRPQPNQAWSVSPRVTPEDRAKIAAALIAPEAAGPTEKLRQRFRVGERFVAANNAEYADAGLAELLRHEWGFF